MKKLLLLLALCGPVLPAAEPADLPGEPRIYKHVDGRDLQLFVYKPADWKATDRRPALVFYHGGGWVQGTPNQFFRHSAYLAQRGMIAISVQYRLLPKEGHQAGTVPVACIADAKSAFRWVRAHAAELGIDPARLGAGGGSAGGYLAGCIALVPGGDDPADDLRVPLQPAALVLFNPGLGARLEDPIDADQAAQLGDRRESFLKSSPANHVRPEAPPTIIFHGELDTTIPPAQILRFQANMRAAGNRCEAVIYPGQKHSFFNVDKSGGRYFRETMVAADRFLASLGWLQGEPVPENLSVETAAAATQPSR